MLGIEIWKVKNDIYGNIMSKFVHGFRNLFRFPRRIIHHDD